MDGIDHLDRKILRILLNDSQKPLAEIGEEVGLSTTALFHRIKNLKQKKIIKKFTIAISENFYESQVSCFVKILKHRKSSIDIAQKLKAIPEVESCYSVTGEESLLIKVRARSAKDFQQVLEVISKVDGVERTVSSLIIDEHFNKGVVVL